MHNEPCQREAQLLYYFTFTHYVNLLYLHFLAKTTGFSRLINKMFRGRSPLHVSQRKPSARAHQPYLKRTSKTAARS